jgi:hypothetical protein
MQIAVTFSKSRHSAAHPEAWPRAELLVDAVFGCL